jgi:hypothetical protein
MRCESAVTISGIGLAAVCGDPEGADCELALGAQGLNASRATRPIRNINMRVTHLVRMESVGSEPTGSAFAL